jgi:small subunit ribosomal protein S8
MSDSVGDMIAAIKNSQQRKAEKLSVPASILKKAVVKVLKDEGFVRDFALTDTDTKRPKLWIYLKYDKMGQGLIRHAQRISKPGRRIFRGVKELPKVLDGMGISIVSTSRGVLSSTECVKLNVGGEVIARVW